MTRAGIDTNHPQPVYYSPDFCLVIFILQILTLFLPIGISAFILEVSATYFKAGQ
jgi:hypothetical protein